MRTIDARPLTQGEMWWVASIRTRAVSKAPFFSNPLFRLQPVAAPGLGTFASDRYGRVYVDPALIDDWSIAEAAGAYVHEMLHVVRRHTERFLTFVSEVDPTMTADKWNYLADMEINDDVASIEGLELPFGGGCRAKEIGQPDGKTAEWYAFRFPDDEEGLDRGFCLGVDAVDGGADIPNARRLTEAELDAVAHATAEAIRRAAEAGTATLPTGLREWADTVLAPPKHNWRHEFRSSLRGALAATTAGKSDYSFRRISRRAENHEVRAGMVAYIPTVAFALDVSGSVSDTKLAEQLAEAQGICAAVGLRGDRVRAFALDTEPGEVRWIKSAKDIVIDRRGGTDMRVAWDVAEAMKPKPDILIVASDGETPWPDAPHPNIKAIALLSPNSSKVPATPEWLRTIVIEEN